MLSRRWGSREMAAAAAFLALVAFQFLLPILALTEPRPARFGWQMYSALEVLPTVRVEGVDGSTREVEIAHLVAYPRFEMQLAAPLARRLCDEHVAAVIIERFDRTERVECD